MALVYHDEGLYRGSNSFVYMGNSMSWLSVELGALAVLGVRDAGPRLGIR